LNLGLSSRVSGALHLPLALHLILALHFARPVAVGSLLNVGRSHDAVAPARALPVSPLDTLLVASIGSLPAALRLGRRWRGKRTKYRNCYQDTSGCHGCLRTGTKQVSCHEYVQRISAQS
jgi:hypothetical protein